MTELFGDVREGDRQGYLFNPTWVAGADAAATEAETRRRPGETALDYRIRRQYREVAATAPLFPPHAVARR
jgi:hypothetical protein